MMKRVFALLLAVIITLGLFSVTALAGSATGCGADCTHEAAIGTTHYDTLAEAVKVAADGDTIALLKAVTDNKAFLPGDLHQGVSDATGGAGTSADPYQGKTTIGSLTLTGESLAGGYINGRKLGGTYAYSYKYVSYNFDIGTLTFKNMAMTDNLYISDLSIEGPGSVAIDSLVFDQVTFDMGSKSLSAAVQIICEKGEIGSITFKNCTFKNCSNVKKPIAIDFRKQDDVSITIEGCSFDAASFNAIQIAGANSNYSGTIKITGNTISNTVNCGIVLNVVSGDLTIADNTMTNATNENDVAVMIVECTEDCTISSISGNTLDGNGLIFANSAGFYSAVANSGLTSGTYLSQPSVADGYIATENSDGTWTVSEKPTPSAPVYTVPTYPVTLSTGAHGSVTASATRASSGSAVVLTVEPKTGYKLDSLLIVDENGKSVAVTQREDGRYCFVMPDCAVSVTTRFLAENWLNPFADVTAADWYYDAVSWACQSGVATGTTATTFSPNGSCTRAQLVTLLWRAAGEPEPASKVNPFSDVSYNSYYKKAVLWAVEQGITTGTSATTFSPDATCTRAEAVTFLFRYAAANGMDAVTLQELVSGYADAAGVPGYSLSAFNWALASKLVQGAGGKLLPNDSCTRAQIVTMLHRYFG